MNFLSFFTGFLGIIILPYISSGNQAAQDPSGKEMHAGYYVVIGAYSPRKEVYARRYVENVAGMGRKADYGFNSKKNLYFVYLDFSENYRVAINEMREIRKTSQFDDAWVFVCSGGVTASSNKDKGSISASAEEKEGDSLKEEAKKSEEPEEVKKDDTEIEADKKEVENIIKEKKIVKKNADLGALSVFFNLVNARNNSDVQGEVQIIDSERSKLLTVEKGGEYVKLADPNNGTGALTLICDVFGYRKAQQEINYNHPLKDTVSEDIDLIADVYTVRFPLVRYHVGDIVIMYNVYYFRDASVMRPESKYEINSLLNMLEENPDYKIRIHGHTNGSRPGKIISMGDSQEFFALEDSNKEGFGSARELSKQRAEAIRNYLISQGIREDRMEIKAWGGKRMLYEKFSPREKENVRVEIEILEE